MMDAVVDGGTRGGTAAGPRAKGNVQLHGQSSETLALQQEIERVARSISVAFGAICVGAAYTITGRQCRELTFVGTIGYAERIGRESRLALAEKRDVLQALLDVTNGTLLFRGKVVDVDRAEDVALAEALERADS